jgi:hypothetical protein
MNSSPRDAIQSTCRAKAPGKYSFRMIAIGPSMMQDRKSFFAWLQAAPMMLIFTFFFLLPLLFVTIVSAWDYNEYEMIPAFSLRGYSDTFEGCIADLPNLCTILKTYLKTLKLCLLTWVLTLLIGFTVAYFLAFQNMADRPRAALHDSVLDLECDPHDRVDSTSWPQRAGEQGPPGRGGDRAATGVAAVLRVFRRACPRSPLHVLHGRADLQFDDPHRQAVDRSRL